MAKKNLVLNNVSVSGTETSQQIEVASSTGFFAIEGTITGSGYSVTFFYKRSDGTNIDSTEYAIGTAITGTTFNIPIDLSGSGYMSHIVIVAKNSTGTANVTAKLVISND